MDLVTIAGLATWTDQVVAGMGSEHVEPLLEIAELRGSLSGQVKQIVLTLARLFDGRPKDSGPTAKDTISMLAQLEALSADRGSADLKLLSLLVQGDLEGAPSTPP